jgi:hypothetical protein
MHHLTLAAEMSVTWFLLPLAAVISLVYSASRYELPEIILRRATRHFVTILVFMALVFLLLLWLSFRL